MATSKDPEKEFPELEELGTAPPPVCQRCNGCKDCTFRRKRLSRDEQAVVSRIEQEMKVDVSTGRITAHYPWKPCAERMSSNRKQAETVQTAMERHMVRAGTHSAYVEEMTKAIQDGKVREILGDEMDKWHGPVHYIVCFAVVKPDSVSTRTRVV